MKIVKAMTAIVTLALTIQIGFITLYVMGMDRQVTTIGKQILGITW
jgi:hypothetical protein